MKGIILAGGTGSRLHPLTLVSSKHLLPIYDKPMIYYPLSTLILAGIKDILLITTKEDAPHFKQLLGNGQNYGISLNYVVQPQPDGLAQAFILGEDFLAGDNVTLILGDNLFYGQGLAETLQRACKLTSGAQIFGYYVKDPERYGVVAFNRRGEISDIQEKPAHPQSNYAIPGLYFFDHEVCQIAKTLKPSPRGELEIVDIIKHYLQAQTLTLHRLSRGIAWLDTGTPTSLLQAANFIEAVEQRQGLKIGCPEEVAYRLGFINREQLYQRGQELGKSEYGRYLMHISHEENLSNL